MSRGSTGTNCKKNCHDCGGICSNNGKTTCSNTQTTPTHATEPLVRTQVHPTRTEDRILEVKYRALASEDQEMYQSHCTSNDSQQHNPLLPG